MSDIVLETHKLVKRFGGLTATNEVSLVVKRGARHALIGPNGAGKTTLINLLTGVIEPSGRRIAPPERKPPMCGDIQPIAVSNNEVETWQPSPVTCRRFSAARMPITAHMPAPWSTIETPTRTGSPPSMPVTLMMPPCACISGS